MRHRKLLACDPLTTWQVLLQDAIGLFDGRMILGQTMRIGSIFRTQTFRDNALHRLVDVEIKEPIP